MITIRNKEMLKQLPEDDSVEEVHLKTRLSKPIIILLLNKFRNLKRIYNPSCYFKNTSKRILNALNKIGIEIIETKNRGRKRKLSWDTVIELYLSGVPISQIAKKFKIQRRSVYYILKKRGIK